MRGLGRIGLNVHTDGLTSAEATESAQQAEALGYAALWFGEGFGRDPLVHAALLLARTATLGRRDGDRIDLLARRGREVGGAHALAEQSGGRTVSGSRP